MRNEANLPLTRSGSISDASLLASKVRTCFRVRGLCSMTALHQHYTSQMMRLGRRIQSGLPRGTTEPATASTAPTPASGGRGDKREHRQPAWRTGGGRIGNGASQGWLRGGPLLNSTPMRQRGIASTGKFDVNQTSMALGPVVGFKTGHPRSPRSLFDLVPHLVTLLAPLLPSFAGARHVLLCPPRRCGRWPHPGFARSCCCP